MPVETVHRYTREMLQQRPGDLFLFGDNMSRVGRGGQAFACRGEPNAVGLPTLWSPGIFFCDNDIVFADVRIAIDEAISKLRRHLRNGGTIVLPADGVGTGLARLPEMAPKIHAYIQSELDSLS